MSTTETLETLHLSGESYDEKSLLEQAEKLHTKPLWKQMNRLNPTLPNPTTIPYIWRYDHIKPSLIRAGELVDECQAERRVLMLVNPARGTQH